MCLRDWRAVSWLGVLVDCAQLTIFRYFPSQNPVPAEVALPQWDSHPESEMAEEEQRDLVVLARLLGDSILWLIRALERTPQEWLQERRAADRLRNDLESSISRLPERRPTLVELASTRIAPDVGEMTENRAGGILQDIILNEINVCDEDGRLDYKKLWTFAEGRSERTKQYFSLDRWPVEVQNSNRREQILASGPRMHRSDRERGNESHGHQAPSEDDDDDDDDDGNNPRGDGVIDVTVGRPRQRHIKGPRRFPFGETPLQELMLSRRMELDLADGKLFTETPGHLF